MSAGTEKVAIGYLTLTNPTDGDEPGPYFVQWSPTNPIPVVFGTVADLYTDVSGTMTTGSTAQTVSIASTTRRGYRIQNLSQTSSLFINDTGAQAVTTALGASMTLLPGAYYESPSAGVSKAAISVNGPTTGQAFAAATW